MNYQDAAKQQVDIYINLFRESDLTVSELEKSKFCYEFGLKDTNEKLKIQVYFGAKGVKTVLQGNKEGNLYKKAEEIIFGKKLFEYNNDEVDEPIEYIGTDESGKGDYFGPLVIAAVLINKDIRTELKQLGVKDSKMLSDYTVTDLARRIKKITEGRWSVVFISPAKYNQLYSRFGNLNKLLAWGHSRAIENILDKFETVTVISDKFGSESLIRNSLFEKGRKIALYQYHQAEKYTAVAAASILARDEVNKWFRINNNKFTTLLPKGASGAVDQAAVDFLKKYGWDVLKENIKEHFKTTRKILSAQEE